MTLSVVDFTPHGSLTIQTVYYRGKERVKNNAAKHPHTATLRAVHHMQLNTYEADVAEVYDAETGKLWIVIKRTMRGINIIFQADIAEYDREKRRSRRK